MRMTDFIMMKMFLSALLVSCIITSILYESTRDFSKKIRSTIKCRPIGYPATILGGTMVGIGMVLSGSCPGSVFPQIGGGITLSYFTIAGGLTGALCYGLVDDHIKQFKLAGSSVITSTTLDELLNLRFSLVAGGMAACLFVILLLLEVYTTPMPYLIVYSPSSSSNYFFNGIYMHPCLSGAIVGLLQIPLMLIVGKGLGTSSSYVAVVGAAFTPILDVSGVKSNYLTTGRKDRSMWVQLFFTVSAIAGAAISSTSSGTYGSINANRIEKNLSPVVVFFGGFIMLFGSRLGGGCTSGHGITGNSLLSLSSLVGTASMFGGGILLAIILTFTNLLPSTDQGCVFCQ